MCIVSGNSMSSQENKMGKFDYYKGLTNKFSESFSNMHMSSFFMDNLMKHLPNHCWPSELSPYIDSKKRGNRNAFMKAISNASSRLADDLDSAYFGFVIATTYNAGKAYINNTMNPLWISKDKWIKKSGFSDQDALIEMRIKLWFPIALEMAEESTRRWINDNKSKGNATATTITDEDKALKIVENRNKKLSAMNLDWYPQAWFAFCLIGYGSTILQDYAVAGSLNTSTSLGYKTDVPGGSFSDELSSPSGNTMSPLQLISRVNQNTTGRMARRKAQNRSSVSPASDTLSVALKVRKVEHIIVPDPGTMLRSKVTAMEEEQNVINKMLTQYQLADDAEKNSWDEIWQQDGDTHKQFNTTAIKVTQ